MIRMGAVMDPGLANAEKRCSAEGLSVQMPPRRSAAAGRLPATSALHHYEISKAEGQAASLTHRSGGSWLLVLPTSPLGEWMSLCEGWEGVIGDANRSLLMY